MINGLIAFNKYSKEYSDNMDRILKNEEKMSKKKKGKGKKKKK